MIAARSFNPNQGQLQLDTKTEKFDGTRQEWVRAFLTEVDRVQKEKYSGKIEKVSANIKKAMNNLHLEDWASKVAQVVKENENPFGFEGILLG